MHTSTIHDFMQSDRSDFEAFREFLKTQLTREVLPHHIIDKITSEDIFKPLHQGVPSYKTWLELLGHFTGLPSTVQIPQGYKIKESISFGFAQKHHMIPLHDELTKTSAYIFANPFRLPLLDWLEYSENTEIYLATPFWIERVLENAQIKHAKLKAEAEAAIAAKEEALKAAMNKHDISGLVEKVQKQQKKVVQAEVQPEPQAQTPSAWSELANISSPVKPAEENAAQRYLHALIPAAKAAGASHIHLEANPGLQARFRVGPSLKTYPLPDKAPPFAAVLLQLKMMGQLDPTHSTYQEGEVLFQHNQTLVTLQLRILPLKGGEKAILSFSDVASPSLPLYVEHLEPLTEALSQPGLILSLGPEPLKPLETVMQDLQVEGTGISLGNHFPSLPAIVNHPLSDDEFEQGEMVIQQYAHDADVLVLEDLFFFKHASTACRLALEGNTLFVPLRFRDATAALMYLLEQGVPTYLLDSALALIGYQDQLPGLCISCRQNASAPLPSALEIQTHFEAPGCEACAQSGQGKPCILQTLIHWDSELESCLYETHQQAPKLRKLLRQKSLASLRTQGRDDVQRGLIAVDDLLSLWPELSEPTP